MKLKVFHRTHYSYGKPVVDSFNEARLQPVDNAAQQRHSFILKVLPSTRLKHYLDFYLNCVHLFELPNAHAELSVEATSIVTTSNSLTLNADSATCRLADLESAAVLNQCYDFLQGSPYVDIGPGTWRMAIDIIEQETDIWQIAQRIMRYVNTEFRYEPNSTHVHTTMQEVLQLRSGVCQDFAHVMLGLCRAIKLPARYISGYLYNGPAEQLKGAQASHAWVEVYIPPHGWIGLDPTNNRIVDGHYVKIGVGRNYSDVPPVRGTYRGTQERKMTVDVLVSLIDKEATVPATNAAA